MAMKLLKLLFLLAITISIVAAASRADEKKEATPGAGAAWSADGKGQNSTADSHLALPKSPESYIELPESEEYSSTSSSDGASDHFRFPQWKKKTCDLFPRICHKKHSPGPDCCLRKCVNVTKDPFNCGMCGCRCKHNEHCCGGRCVNTSFDPRNCSRCGNKCKKWEACIYGMCSYA